MKKYYNNYCDQIAKVDFVSIADRLGENVLGILNGLWLDGNVFFKQILTLLNHIFNTFLISSFEFHMTIYHHVPTNKRQQKYFSFGDPSEREKKV